MNAFDTIAHPRDAALGQFVDKPQSKPQVRIAADGMTSGQREQRHAALLESNFIPAVSGAAEASGTSRANVATWWDSHFVRAEYRQDSAGYPQMPDDYTPAGTSGNALSGGRRTHRMSYSGDEVTVRMPSASSIKRFAKSHAGTFDVPITGTFDGGNISGWVRVTQNGPSEWSVQGLNFPAGASAQVSEAVSAVLEARRPSTGLRDAGDLMQRRAERFAAAGSKISPSPKNSFVSGAGYDKNLGVLAVKIGDRTYGYKAPAGIVRAFGNASSIGAAYNRLIKGSSTTAVVECQKCHRFTVGRKLHRCPSAHKQPLDAPIAHTISARGAALAASR
jgi:hypothetical protein